MENTESNKINVELLFPYISDERMLERIKKLPFIREIPNWDIWSLYCRLTKYSDNQPVKEVILSDFRTDEIKIDGPYYVAPLPYDKNLLEAIASIVANNPLTLVPFIQNIVKQTFLCFLGVDESKRWNETIDLDKIHPETELSDYDLINMDTKDNADFWRRHSEIRKCYAEAIHYLSMLLIIIDKLLDKDVNLEVLKFTDLSSKSHQVNNFDKMEGEKNWLSCHIRCTNNCDNQEINLTRLKKFTLSEIISFAQFDDLKQFFEKIRILAYDFLLKNYIDEGYITKIDYLYPLHYWEYTLSINEINSTLPNDPKITTIEDALKQIEEKMKKVALKSYQTVIERKVKKLKENLTSIKNNTHLTSSAYMNLLDQIDQLTEKMKNSFENQTKQEDIQPEALDYLLKNVEDLANKLNNLPNSQKENMDDKMNVFLQNLLDSLNLGQPEETPTDSQEEHLIDESNTQQKIKDYQSKMEELQKEIEILEIQKKGLSEFLTKNNIVNRLKTLEESLSRIEKNNEKDLENIIKKLEEKDYIAKEELLKILENYQLKNSKDRKRYLGIIAAFIGLGTGLSITANNATSSKLVSDVTSSESDSETEEQVLATPSVIISPLPEESNVHIDNEDLNNSMINGEENSLDLSPYLTLGRKIEGGRMYYTSIYSSVPTGYTDSSSVIIGYYPFLNGEYLGKISTNKDMELFLKQHQDSLENINWKIATIREEWLPYYQEIIQAIESNQIVDPKYISQFEDYDPIALKNIEEDTMKNNLKRPQ